MTTTVTVESRAWGAVVETNGERLEMGPNQERKFHIAEGTQSFNVTQPAEAPAEEVVAEEVTADTSNRGKRPDPSTVGIGNKTGADETAARS